MKRNRLIILCALVALSFPAIAFSMPWSWDMFSQESHKAQEEAAPVRPEGTVSHDGKPFNTKDKGAAAAVKNPVPVSDASVERGKRMFGIYCATCHGDTGNGDGPVGKKYITPTNLNSDYVQGKPDGDIYFTITNGGLAIMPAYGDALNPEDRWHIVNYIKATFGKSAQAAQQGGGE